MDDKIRQTLSNSLFSQQSLFNSEPLVVPPPPPLAVGKTVLSSRALIEDLIEDAIAAIRDEHSERALDALEEIRDLIRKT